MKKYLLLLSCIACIQVYSQKFSLSGKVIDTNENKSLANAVVSLIRPTDSVLVKFTRTKADGSFTISNLPGLKYEMLITYPGYADYVDFIRDTSISKIDVGSIQMTRKSQLLETVIVKQKIAAIRMKGDTLAFLADSFAVRQGATVDELLKKLPGIQVDRSGNITVQGQKVEKVLVDGEEFFNEDPAVVIKNLQAEAVKEVQVFDKKSDQAAFTGIDDGERSKTINLTLKDNKKKGYYGKADVNGGAGGKFDNSLMANSFRGTQKMAAYGIMSNTGTTGLGWQDSEKFGGGNNIEYDQENGYFTQSRNDDEFESQGYNIEGLPTSWTGGLHYSDKWRGERKKINANYRFLKTNIRAEGNTISQYILPDTQYFNDQASKSVSSKTGNQLKGIYELKFDSMSNMKVTVLGNTLRTDNASRLQSSALNADSGRVNNNERLLNSTTAKDLFNASILWRKKFKKAGRTLSLNLDQQSMQQNMDGKLMSGTDYFNEAGGIYKQEKVDQKKANKQDNIGIKSNLVYTEPLSKTLFLSVNYGYNFKRSQASRNSFNKDGSEYNKLDSLYSNDFRYRYDIHSTGADIKYNKKKFMMIIGSGVNFSGYEQTDQIRDSSKKYSFVNYYPKFSIRFSPRTQRSLSFRYNGNNNPPSLEQLQPVRENTNPLIIQLGNPGLRQEFVHTFSFNFRDYKMLSERGVYLDGYAQVFQHAISNSTVVDAGGKTIFQPINVDGNFFTRLFANYGFKTKWLGMYLNFGADYNFSRSNNKVNNQDNTNNNTSISGGPSISKYQNDKFNFYIQPRIGYTYSTSSIRPDVVTKYFTNSIDGNCWTKLPWKFEFETTISINQRQKTDAFDKNRNSIKWDANINRKFLKKNNLELSFSVNDILDQNIGFNRTATSNIITENSYNTLRRFFMLGIQYNITKTQ